MIIVTPINIINKSMSFHTSHITCLPQELIMTIFDMFTNVNDIINYAESNEYVFNIYKANIDKILKQLINNNKKNKVHNIIWSFYYNKYFNNNYNIDTKLDIAEKIGNYLSNYDSYDLESILLLRKGDVEKVFELHDEYSISILDSVSMLDNFNEIQIEKTKRLISDNNLYSEIAYNLVKKFTDAEIEIFIKLSKILIKENDDDDDINDNLTLRLIASEHRDETILNIMLKLAENNFKEDDLIYITYELVDNDDYEYSIMKCIELKNKGISEQHILYLVESSCYKKFDYEYYESLIKDNHTSEEAIDRIIEEHENYEEYDEANDEESDEDSD